MTFKRNGRLHRIAYTWNPKWQGENLPEKTSICELFWLTIFAIFLVWPGMFVWHVFWWVVRIVGAIPVFLLFGYKPAGNEWSFFSEETNSLPFEPVYNWPTFHGYRIEIGTFLIYLLVIVAVFLGLGVVFKTLVFDPIIVGFFWETSVGNVVGSTIFIFILSFWVRSIVRNSEGWQMTKGFIKAKKDRYCPMVEFR